MQHNNPTSVIADLKRFEVRKFCGGNATLLKLQTPIVFWRKGGEGGREERKERGVERCVSGRRRRRRRKRKFV